jgi:hypothetical protein
VSGAEFDEVDIDLLADYIGGALAGTPDETAVAARIAEDPAWRTAYESLSGGMDLVGAELGRWESEPMPDELAASLDAMFRAETPAIDGGTLTPAAMTPRLTVVDGEGAGSDAAPAVRKKEGRRRRWTAPIAIAAGLVAFVGFGLDYLSGRDSASEDTASSNTAGVSADAGAEVGGMRRLSSGTNYTLDTLAAEPVQPLTAPGLSAPAAPHKDTADGSVGPSGALSRLSAPAALQECLDAIELANAGGTIAVQTVDFARFDGSPAVIVRFTASNRGWAWASGPGCGAHGGDAATLGKVPVG